MCLSIPPRRSPNPWKSLAPSTLQLFAASDARDQRDSAAAFRTLGPDGKAIVLVRAGRRRPALAIVNGREAEPTLLTPGKVERYQIDLGSIGHRFMPGHSVRVEGSQSAAAFYCQIRTPAIRSPRTPSGKRRTKQSSTMALVRPR